MAQKLNLGTGLLALIGGGLQGFNQGTAYRAQQKLQKEERDRQIANEERLFRKEQEKNEGQLLYGSALSSLLNLPTNVSLDDPVYNDLTQQALKGATMAGIDSGQALQTAFTMARAKRPQPVSPLDQAKMDKDKAELLFKEEGAIRDRGKQVSDLIEGFEGVTEQDISSLIETGRIPAESLPRLKPRVKPSGVTVNIGDKIREKGAEQAATRAIEISQAIPLVDTLEQQFLALKPGSGIEGKLESIAKTWAGKAGVSEFTEFSSYGATAQSISTLLARNLGDRGNIAVAEREINSNMMPKSTDNKEQGLSKVRNMRQILQAVQTSNWELAKKLLSDSGVNFSEFAPQQQATPQQQAAPQQDVPVPSQNIESDYIKKLKEDGLL